MSVLFFLGVFQACNNTSLTPVNSESNETLTDFEIDPETQGIIESSYGLSELGVIYEEPVLENEVGEVVVTNPGTGTQEPDPNLGQEPVISDGEGNTLCLKDPPLQARYFRPELTSKSKILVCKVPPGNTANEHNILVSPKAVKAHLNKGSYLGPCEGTVGEIPPVYESCE